MDDEILISQCVIKNIHLIIIPRGLYCKTAFHTESRMHLLTPGVDAQQRFMQAIVLEMGIIGHIEHNFNLVDCRTRTASNNRLACRPSQLTMINYAEGSHAR